MMVKCLNCEKEYDSNYNRCTSSYSIDKEVTICDEITIDDFQLEINSQEKHKGKPEKRYFCRYEEYKKTGEIVKRCQDIDHLNDHYFEKVETLTGHVLHYCDEKLTEHINHGSAKHLNK